MTKKGPKTHPKTKTKKKELYHRICDIWAGATNKKWDPNSTGEPIKIEDWLRFIEGTKCAFYYYIPETKNTCSYSNDWLWSAIHYIEFQNPQTTTEHLYGNINNQHPKHKKTKDTKGQG